MAKEFWGPYKCWSCQNIFGRQDVWPKVGTPHPRKGPWACRQCYPELFLPFNEIG